MDWLGNAAHWLIMKAGHYRELFAMTSLEIKASAFASLVM